MLPFNLDQVLTTAGVIIASVPAVFVYTQIVKKANSVPWLQEGMKTRLRAFSGVLSALSVILLGWSSGVMTPESIQGVLESIFAFISIWFGSHGMYEAQKPKGNT